MALRRHSESLRVRFRSLLFFYQIRVFRNFYELNRVQIKENQATVNSVVGNVNSVVHACKCLSVHEKFE